MYKTLTISNYRQNGGWSAAARAHIRAMVQAGIQIVPAHVMLGEGDNHYPDIDRLRGNIKECENNVQFVLPNFGHADRRFKRNIISYFVETDRVPPHWTEVINTFDKVVVATQAAYQASRYGGVKTDIEIIPIPVNIDELEAPTNSKLQLRNNLGNKCIFYTIVDQNPRKNIEDLIKAFHLTFHPSEDVELVIKMSGDPQKSAEYIKKASEYVKKGLRLYPEKAYKTIITMTGNAPRADIVELHKQCDVYVSTSKGEGFSIPTIEAAALGNPCVVPRHSAFLDYFNNNDFSYVSTLTPCFGAHAPDELHTGRENWWEPDIIDLCNKMRLAFDYWKNNIHPICIDEIQHSIDNTLDVECVGKAWRELLTS